MALHPHTTCGTLVLTALIEKGSSNTGVATHVPGDDSMYKQVRHCMHAASTSSLKLQVFKSMALDRPSSFEIRYILFIHLICVYSVLHQTYSLPTPHRFFFSQASSPDWLAVGGGLECSATTATGCCRNHETTSVPHANKKNQCHTLKIYILFFFQVSRMCHFF